MFGVGPQELLIIGVLFLLIFGPGKATGMARDLGRFVSGAQNTVEEFKEELVSEEVREARRTVGEVKSELTAPVQEFKDGVRHSEKELGAEVTVGGEGDEAAVDPSPDDEDGKHRLKDGGEPLHKEEAPPPSRIRAQIEHHR